MMLNALQVCHDCKNDSAALAFGWNVTLDNVFDTQVTRVTLSHFAVRR